MNDEVGERSVYDRWTILFHWLVAGLVAAQWLGAHAIDWFPRGALRTDARSLHITLGAALAVLLIARLPWRWTGGRKLPPADRGGLRLLAVTVQGLLYLLLFSTVALGVLNATVRGDDFFGLVRLPKLFAYSNLRDGVGGAHELSANLILLLAAVHSGAALMHHFLWKDGLLGRVIPVLASKP